MAAAEKAYQLKGHAKFVDIARLFGWDGLNAFWYSINDDYENGIIWSKHGSNIDDLIFRWCQSVGVDLRPLFHFWGTHPVNANSLKSRVEAEGLQPSSAIYDLLVHYKSLVPADNAAFQTFALGWWGHQPSIGGNWTEREHARQWDEEVLWENQHAPNGEIYVEGSCTRIKAVIDGLLELYFFFIDAGDDMIAWSGLAVELDATVENESVPGSTYAWSADPAAGVVFSATNVQDPTVTITKPAGDPITVTLTLVFDDGTVPVQDTMTIDVYDDACKATLAAGKRADNPTDIVGDGCITNLEDFAEMAKKWLVDQSLTAPVVK